LVRQGMDRARARRIALSNVEWHQNERGEWS